jgi:RNA polymerase sigma-70 factor (ECF subfamily)
MRTAASAYEDQLSGHHLLFEREVACCQRQLYSAAIKMTGHPSDAEDLLQETLTRAYAGLAGYRPGSNAKAWLYRIMANAFVNTCRQRRHEPVPVLHSDLETPHSASAIRGVSGGAVSAPSAEDQVLGNFVHSEFRQALGELPSCFQATIYLADVEGYSYRDVAEMVGVPIGTVMSRLHRGRRRLRRRLAVHIPARSATESVSK